MNRLRSLVFILAVGVLSVAATLHAADTAPLKWGGSLLKQKPEWYASADARAPADNVLRYQSREGA